MSLKEIDETEVFLVNIKNIIKTLNLSKTKFNSALGWPSNKFLYILKGSQPPLLVDITTIRKFLDLEPNILTTKILTTEEIDNLSDKLNNLKKEKNTGQGNNTYSPIDYLIVILGKKYIKDSTFTKKGLLKDMPAKYDNYKIEWDKNRLRNYIEKVEKTGKTELTFKLSSSLPDHIIETSVSAVDSDWLKEFEEKVKKSNG